VLRNTKEMDQKTDATKMVKCYSASLETHFRATERHLPYGITQSYLPPDTGERETVKK